MLKRILVTAACSAVLSVICVVALKAMGLAEVVPLAAGIGAGLGCVLGTVLVPIDKIEPLTET